MIWLIPHMETDWNAEGRFTAQAFHIRLNEAGIAQAERMADQLIRIELQTVYCSDQIRGIETAIIIASLHTYVNKFVTDPRLREVNVGSLVGKFRSSVGKNSEFSTRHPNFDYTSIGGENKQQVIARYGATIKDIRAKNDHEDSLVVGHGTAIRVYLESIGITKTLTRENYICL